MSLVILVTGVSGSGKSTFVNALASRLSLPIVPEPWEDYHLLHSGSGSEEEVQLAILTKLAHRDIPYDTGCVVDCSPLFSAWVYPSNSQLVRKLDDYYRKFLPQLMYTHHFALKASTQLILERTARRGRDYEQSRGTELIDSWRQRHEVYANNVEPAVWLDAELSVDELVQIAS